VVQGPDARLRRIAAPGGAGNISGASRLTDMPPQAEPPSSHPPVAEAGRNWRHIAVFCVFFGIVMAVLDRLTSPRGRPWVEVFGCLGLALLFRATRPRARP
jgi:hypothetical protein